MKGRIGAHMRYKGFIVPRTRYLSRVRLNDITHEAQQRLHWMEYYHKTGNARLTCRHFGISPDTFYRWQRRYQPHHLNTLESQPQKKRPHRLRQPTTPLHLVNLILALRQQYPRWGKEKLARLIWKAGYPVSVSMVGRTITRLQFQGLLHEPIINYISSKKRYVKRAWAVRKPETFKANLPGDLVEVDTMDIRPIPGVVRKQFTARDIISKWDTLQVFAHARATLAAQFLDYLLETSPFPIKAVQIDGGSEFKGEFEQACQDRGIILYVLPPRSPKLNGCVERSNRTHTEEFYEVNDFSLNLEVLNQELNAWTKVYNTVRPHQALNYLTPLEYLTQWYHAKGESVRYVPN